MTFRRIWQLYCDECGEPYDQSLIVSSSRRFVVTTARSEGWRFPRPAGPMPSRKVLCPACAIAPQMPLAPPVNITPIEGVGFAPDSVIIKPVDITHVEIYSTAPGGGSAGIFTREAGN